MIMKYEGISKYKLNKIAIESFRNALRLHFDAILLFNNGSYPSAYQLAILSLEEFSKAEWIDHYVWTSKTNDCYSSAEEEHEWLKLLYLHPRKQWNFVAREWQYYSPSFLDFVQNGKLEHKKQNSIYVGLARSKGKVDTSSRISTPSKIKQTDAKQIISLMNTSFIKYVKE